MTRYAYVDTSCLVAIAFREKGASAVRRRLERFDDLFSANLLEAELRAAMLRERVDEDPDLLNAVSWILPDRPLTPEITRILDTGYLRGADSWHVATALFLVEDPSEISFMTLDERQRTLATDLGFRT